MNPEQPNLKAKHLVEHAQEQFGKKTIEVEWEGSLRRPKEIEIDGEKKATSYMADGIITFMDGTSATYERLVDYPQSPQRIRLTYTPKRKVGGSEMAE